MGCVVRGSSQMNAAFFRAGIFFTILRTDGARCACLKSAFMPYVHMALSAGAIDGQEMFSCVIITLPVGFQAHEKKTPCCVFPRTAVVDSRW